MEPKQIYVKPAIKLGTKDTPVTVRWPDKPTITIPAEGMYVPRTPYWLRRIQDGSVHEATPPKAPAKKSTTKE